jgi:nucleobase:cation symporter-1, NCS1 family
VLSFLIPWTSINLFDFYVIHHGNYRTEDFFSKHGTFGKWGWPAIITYFVAFAVELPFVHTTFIEGPIARAMGGVDLAWLVGSLVSIPLYRYLAKRKLKLRHLDLGLHYRTGSIATAAETTELPAESQQ